MIKLTLNPDFHPTTLTFHKKAVTIGSSKTSEVDLLIPDEQLQEVHVKIVEQEGKFMVINQANDPFVALNDRPFGKREIKTGDQLSIRDDIILFEGKAASFEPEMAAASKIEQVEKPKEIKKPLPLMKAPGWRPLTVFLGIVSVFALLFAGGIYLNLSEKSEVEEMRAAEGVADVVMALTYAKLHHETPQKMNWSDPIFLNRLLYSILSQHHSKATTIESNGRFKDRPFFVRIYSNADLSHFLVIAQPIPSMRHWLIGQKAIILDSDSMELRRTKAVKDLNRLLASMDDFEGAIAEEISIFVEQEQPISLEKVALKGGNKEFAIPALLAEGRPGAENLIYNAPRYHGIGEAILDEARHLMESSSNSKEIAFLKDQIDFISKLSDFVFYSSKAKETALEGLKALATILPEKEFLIGYLKFNDKGALESSHLIGEDEKVQATKSDPEEVMAEMSTQIVLSLEKPVSLFELAREKQPVQPQQEKVEVDGNHPLFLKLKALSVFREQNLQVISQEMIDRLKKQNSQPQANFLPAFQDLLGSYDQENRNQMQKIIQDIIILNQKFSSIPFNEFLSYVKAAGLFAYLQEHQKQNEKNIITKEELEGYLAEIQHAANLQELDQVATELSSLLTLKNIPDFESLVAYQNAVSYHVLQKLAQFLLKPTEDKARNSRDLILHVLKTSWISDPDVVEYYLNEHDQNV